MYIGYDKRIMRELSEKRIKKLQYVIDRWDTDETNAIAAKLKVKAGTVRQWACELRKRGVRLTKKPAGGGMSPIARVAAKNRIR